jgi:hypothetical protein
MKTLFAVLLLLAGCASGPSPHYLGAQALRQGDLPTAERHLRQAVSQGESSAWNDLGVVYGRQGRIQLAVDAFKMAARYGDPMGKENLARHNLPIPPADLVKQEQSNSAVIGELFDSYRGNSIKCSTVNAGAISSTTCK